MRHTPRSDAMADDTPEKAPEGFLQHDSAGRSIDIGGVPSHPLPGIVVETGQKYRIREEVGSGGMKSVLRTLECATHRHVAMAVLRDPLASRRNVARFVREARITAALEHPNIVPVHDFGLDDAGKPYFTMRLLGGETLRFILQRINAGYGDYRSRYPLSGLLQIFRGVCNAVSFAHSRGVVHLDLKPANIQVGDFGEVLVLDWGLAEVLDKDPALYPNRLVLEDDLLKIHIEGVSGTPAFMSPEQARGNDGALDERTDIFALGAILSAILDCRKPTDATDPKARHDNPKPPAALEAVAAKAMAKEPSKRYQTVEELAKDVRAYVDGYATAAQQASAMTLVWLLVKRHRVVASLIAVSLAAVFTILVISLVIIRNSEQVALDALDKIRTEKADKYKLGLLAAPQLLQQANDAAYLLDYDKALSIYEQRVALDGKPEEAWWAIIAIHMGRWEFDQSRPAFAHVPKADTHFAEGRPMDLLGIQEKYSRLGRGLAGEALRKAQEDFAYDLIAATSDAWIVRRLAMTEFLKNLNSNPSTVNFHLIERMLQSLNTESKNLVFTHENTPDGLKVSLHGEKVTDISPLIGLPIRILDLSDTGNVGLDWLRNAPLDSVDLSRSSAGNVRILDQWPAVRQLRLIDWRDKDYNRLLNFPHLERVIVSANDVNFARDILRTMPHPPEVVGE